MGVAINTGSEITVNAAGIVLMKDSLYDVVNAIRIARSSFRRIKINFVWAFLYNILLIPIAMGVLYPANGFMLDPMLAGLAMAMSSISVVLSSLMLKFFKPLYKLESSTFRHKVFGMEKEEEEQLTSERKQARRASLNTTESNQGHRRVESSGV